MLAMRAGSIVPAGVAFEATGLRLRWRRRCAAARYAGAFLPWSAIRDADPTAAPPEIRLTTGRTVFITAQLRDELTDALSTAAVSIVRRPDVWGHLLEPYLDTDYDIVKERFESDLLRWGFTEAETRRIRRRVRIRMLALTLLTWEWAYYGQSDLLMARFGLPPRWTPWWRYRHFREWTDVIADRPTERGQR
jgi:hypothetical protein